jgi:ribonuclease VapC
VIVVDTSAIMAIALNEPQALDCQRAIASADAASISAGTLSEILVVASGRGVAVEVQQILDVLAPEIVSVDGAMATKIADAYQRWGKGNHPARLNLGDCFAYALAEDRGWPLLFVGKDFSQTNVRSVL